MLWCMKRTNIYLDEEQAALLDQRAAQEGLSRAELIRRMLDKALTGGGDSTLEADVAVLNDSFGVACDVAWPVRETGDREEHLQQVWNRTQ